MKKVILITLLALSSFLTWSQETPVSSESIRKDALNVYMDATDYIKKEIPFINYVRDRKVADVYIISTLEETGSGGYVTTYFLVGQDKYAGMTDTLKCEVSPDETTETIRSKQVRVLKLGLIRYILKTPLGQYMNLNFSLPLSETVTTDKWNSWVFSTSLSGYTNAQKTYKYSYLYGTLSANRITEKSKFESRIGIDLAKDKNFLEDTTYSSSTKYESLYLSYVKSITDHWSAGGNLSLMSSSYNNFDFSSKINAGIEYDIFPYKESTRRLLTIAYNTGLEYNNYNEITTRMKNEETLAYHTLAAALVIIQKWGSINSTISWKNYFFNWSYNNLRIYSRASLRIVKGLNVYVSGSASLIHDQISLPLGGATLEEILLRRKIQATSYSYYTNFGFTYTFGSIYNNVVNPRFSN